MPIEVIQVIEKKVEVEVEKLVYVDRIIERPIEIERIVEVEKIIEKVIETPVYHERI